MPSATFTYTPSSTGNKSITVTNTSTRLSNPSAVSYNSTAVGTNYNLSISSIDASATLGELSVSRGYNLSIGSIDASASLGELSVSRNGYHLTVSSINAPASLGALSLTLVPFVTEAEQMLAEVKAAILLVLQGQSYRIKDRELTRVDLPELTRLEDRLKWQIANEKRKQAIANGLPDPSRIKIRFR